MSGTRTDLQINMQRFDRQTVVSGTLIVIYLFAASIIDLRHCLRAKHTGSLTIYRGMELSTALTYGGVVARCNHGFRASAYVRCAEVFDDISEVRLT